MEKINIAEILKNCPKGMELNCLLFNNPVKYNGCDNDSNYPIEIITDEDEHLCLTNKGYLFNRTNSKCIIFPKGKTTWEGFHKPFEPGDIVITDNNEHAFIYSGENNRFYECYCGVYCGTRNIGINSKVWSDKQHNIRLATKEEIEKLFQVIKDNGYEWNDETKTLEQLIEPIFKAGNKIRSKNKKDECFYILNVDKERNKYILNIKGYCLEFKDQNNYELVSDKFNIGTLKPFDKVLVRDTDKGYLDITFYEFYDKTNKSYPYRTLGGTVYKQCIPYEDNEHLAGIVEDCDDYYKTWINEENEFD